MSYYTPARVVQWVPRINKKVTYAPLHTKEHFWDDAYTKILLKVYLLSFDGGFIYKSAYYIVPLKAKTIEQQPQSLYSPSYGTGIHLRTI